MVKVQQFRGVSILHHGVLVWNELSNIVNGNQSKLPSWLDVSKLLNYVSIDELMQYTILHDCGKPNCVVVDDNGRKQFPNHALVSMDVYDNYYNNLRVSEYIGNDMFLHTCTSEQAQSIDVCEKEWLYAGLLLASFAELYANSNMFGGTDSVSFKIKYKQLDKKGKIIFNKLV